METGHLGGAPAENGNVDEGHVLSVETGTGDEEKTVAKRVALGRGKGGANSKSAKPSAESTPEQ